MDILAILCVRNEAPRLRNCLSHLRRNGISYAVIDNDSSDASPDILREPDVRNNLVAMENLSYDGAFDMARILALKRRIIEREKPDWFIHHDADEVMHSYVNGERLGEAIARQDALGFTAIDFNEFVFLPIDSDYQAAETAWQNLSWYYFFQPVPQRLVRAGKTGAVAINLSSGGHGLVGDGLRLAEEKFALRHYIFTDQAHALAKYATRVFSTEGLARGWHENRHGKNPVRFYFPPPVALKRLETPQSREFDRSDPKKKHYWEW